MAFKSEMITKAIPTISGMDPAGIMDYGSGMKLTIGLGEADILDGGDIIKDGIAMADIGMADIIRTAMEEDITDE